MYVIVQDGIEAIVLANKYHICLQALHIGKELNKKRENNSFLHWRGFLVFVIFKSKDHKNNFFFFDKHVLFSSIFYIILFLKNSEMLIFYAWEKLAFFHTVFLFCFWGKSK